MLALAQTLFAPLDIGAVKLAADARVLVLGARDGQGWRQHAGPHWCCEQGFRPWHDALRAAGLAATERVADATFDAALIFTPRQRERARALYARAAALVGEGGTILAAQRNDQGARSAQADFGALLGAAEQHTQRKCRVFWARRQHDRIDAERLAQWQALDTPQPILGGRWWSRPGLFAWDRIDAGSALLAAQLPTTLAGRVADLGAGHGYLACAILERCPQVDALDLYEAEALAREPALRNLAAAVAASGRAVDTHFHWHDVRQGLTRSYDAIVTNPPFHEGRADEPELGRAFIAAAAAALAPTGELWLVANRHLRYEALLVQRFSQVRELACDDGYKVIHATGPRA
ncbi:MAG: class I SAM-dependent methyltransferase [Dokdonella sp.]|uniref:class I SAM-dependent methyltransferase n=1 Tax=Dokdonella sp. TaxID=2291710 RepID=UPI0025BA2E09|nr:methyltransferase [Dokdonella sp.]MBX3701355.1 class I SAM-dependent methyltransferase [Dokdonella sp.]